MPSKEQTVPPEWMKKEQDRASQTTKSEVPVNHEVPTPKARKQKSMKPANQQQKAPFVERSYKGFRPTKDRVGKFDILVATQKNSSGKNGPDLIDEALDLLFNKYDV